MQVSLENTGSLQRRMTVSLPAERLDGVVGRRLQEIGRTARLKGFRPPAGSCTASRAFHPAASTWPGVTSTRMS